MSSPVRRWVLTALLVPAVALVLRKLARLLQRRNDGEPTTSSRTLFKLSGWLRRLTGKDAEPSGAEDDRKDKRLSA
ncbi:MAG: hypothetical protein SW019_16540 [Actinomycetota bacterium]|nr:hypothetical protein [Actinomycetota bacterium]